MNGEAGRPLYQPTEADRNTVKSMAATGFSHESIARCLGKDGIDPKTLRLHFRRELDTAADMANARIGQVAFQKAAEGEPWAVCFWMKCRAGWRETHVIAGDPNSPLQLNVSAGELLRSRIDSIAERKRAVGSTDDADGRTSRSDVI